MADTSNMTAKQFRQYIYNLEREATNNVVKREFDTERQLENMYQTATNRIQGQIDDFYLKYANENGVSVAEARKKASKMDVEKYAKRAKKAVKDKDFSPQANEWLKTYNLKLKTSRLEIMKADINLELLGMYSDLEKEAIASMVAEARAEAVRQAGILADSAQGAVKRIKAVADSDIFGAEFSRYIWGANGHYDQTRKEVFRAISNMNVDMSGYRKARNELASRMGVSKSHAMRLIRTEQRRIISDTQMNMYDENGFTHYVYVAEFGACDECEPLANKVFLVGDAVMGANIAPMHPNCRCSSYGYIQMQRKVNGEWVDEVPEQI